MFCLQPIIEGFVNFLKATSILTLFNSGEELDMYDLKMVHEKIT